MKLRSMKLIKLNRVQILLIGAAFLLVAPAAALATKDGLTRLRSKAAYLLKARAAVMEQQAPVNDIFTVRGYGGKCMEYGRGPAGDPTVKRYPVFINQCNGTAAQQIRVEELTDRPGHLVVLRAGDRVIGAKIEQVGSTGDPPGETDVIFIKDQTPLETQFFTNSPGQIFALDGDSIILAADRTLVFEVENNRGRNLTPLVLGRRDLADSEFWDFIALGSSPRPTSGFRSVSTANCLKELLPDPRPEPGTPEAITRARPGTVIEVDPGATIELTGIVLRIPAGVTLRGGRRGLLHGAELWTDQPATETMLTVDGDDVRVTGLILTGTSGSSESDAPPSRGILVQPDSENPVLRRRVIIDHNEMRNWTDQAVDVWGKGNLQEVCDDFLSPKNFRIIPNVRVARNFIHHNRKKDAGYGVEAHYGGFPQIEGNTFNENRHAIMADGKGCTKYYAWYNLVLPDAPCQHWFVKCIHHTHDFDVHGTGWNGFGGRAGHYFDVGWNTFLGTNRQNFDLRGKPTVGVEYHHNTSLRSREDAVGCTRCGEGNDKLFVYDNNQFNAPDPTANSRSGDFDGDGLDDRFMATGAAWYYSLGGQTEWRFINAQPEKSGDLLFVDFDADGRTDVLMQRDSAWFVSWGGASKWEKIIQTPDPNSHWRFLDASYNGRYGSSDGSFRRPYTRFADAMFGAPEGGTLWFLRTQTIRAGGTYGKRITIKAPYGVKATLVD